MKYGLLDFEKTVQWYWKNTWNNKALLNIGDAAEYLAIKQLYCDLGIADEQMIPLCIHDLITYRGESLIVPLNLALDSYVGYNEILDHLSPDIVPVFLGMSLTSTDLNEAQLRCLQNYVPIGCRDQRSYEFLKAKGISCYLNGCCASLLRMPPVSKQPSLQGKILFIDVPQSILQYVPQSVRADAVFLKQEVYCKQENIPGGVTPNQWVQSILSAYGSDIKAIVTSRFHGAVLALAFNIPVLVALEQKTFRFSWLENYCQVVEDGGFDSIDWSFPMHDYAVVQRNMRELCLHRIKKIAEEIRPYLEMTDAQKTSNLQQREKTNFVLYYEAVLKQIYQRWNQDEEIHFAFWGINQNSVCLLQAIQQKYPKAKLVAIYDMNRMVEFEGIQSKHPNDLANHRNEKNFFLIVTAYLASRVADDIFANTGFPESQAFLCERAFLTKEDF